MPLPLLIAASLIVPPCWGWCMYWVVTRWWPGAPPSSSTRPPMNPATGDIDYHI